MKKLFWALSAALAAFSLAGGAFASARLEGMEADPRQVGDIDLIWAYPNLVTDYKNTVDFRMAPNGIFGDGANEWGGVLTELDPSFGVLGVYVNRPAVTTSPYIDLWNNPEISMLAFTELPVGGFFVPPTQNQADLFWGKGFSGGNLGFHFGYGHSVMTSPFELWTESYSLDGGLGLDHAGPFDTLNLHAGYGFQDISTSGAAEDFSGVYTAKVGALASSGLDADDTLRLFTDLNFNGAKDNLGDSVGQWGMVLGSSFNRKVDGGKGLLSSGLLLGYGDVSGTAFLPPFNFNLDEWDLLWNLSAEVPVADWLTVRAGLAKLLWARVHDAQDVLMDGTYYDPSSNNVQFNTGFGISWENFTLNASVSAQSLEDSINQVQPGNGFRFSGNIVTVEDADLSYKF